ncbi:MAG: electron transfer flavoprotein-ubiquinone oxidoreductase [Burkholderiaceae bacterium]|jgi:electron-transferring-flavoprotein dehydrogenase|nr:electron transfer flavoprotein-ubiquinone oxidoreductase [Burkholderiaceae bacterium]
MTPEQILEQYGPRETMEYDVVIVGAGPAGLSAAIRLKQLAAQKGREVSVVVLEKGSEPGAHILSGAIMDPRAITELLPDWKEKGAPLKQPITGDAFLMLSEKGGVRMPNMTLPACFHNEGNYIVSLGNVVRWLAGQAEALGVEIFPGFAAAQALYGADGSVRGVATGNMGIGKDGEPTGSFQLGMELRAKYTLFAEGSRGHLGRGLIEKFGLDKNSDPQSYGIGIKELWEIDPSRHTPGLALHSAGWPLSNDTYGGAFMYHAEDNKIYCGYVVGLSYANPYLSPFEEFQRWKTHPRIRRYFTDDQGNVNAKRLSYGARAITAGGLLAVPKTVFPGGALVGCDAGFLNVSRIKGSHAAIKTGMLAAEAAFDALAAGRQHDELSAYPQAFEASWLRAELNKDRNYKTWFKSGLLMGTTMTGIEQYALRGRIPWTVHRKDPDYALLQEAAQRQPIDYPKPDGKLTFDRLSGVFISNTNHEENQPAHLTLKDPAVPVRVNLARYAGPEQRYCPAGVYEFMPDPAQGEGAMRLQINAQNCLHCKTCDIKDPTQNIVWVPPEGGGGPNYSGM